MSGLNHEYAKEWEELIGTFADMSTKGFKYEREVIVHGPIDEPFPQTTLEVANDINQALGGKLFLGEKLAYVDGVFVAGPDLSAAT